MCDPHFSGPDAAPQERPQFLERPAKLLADLMQVQLGVTVDPGRLHTFVASNFNRISKLAHAIHGEYGA